MHPLRFIYLKISTIFFKSVADYSTGVFRRWCWKTKFHHEALGESSGCKSKDLQDRELLWLWLYLASNNPTEGKHPWKLTA